MDISNESEMVAKIVSSLLNIKHNLRLVFQHAVSSVIPDSLIRREVNCTGDSLTVGNKTYILSNNVYLIGFGKAVLGMGYHLELKLGSHLKAGVLSIPVGQRNVLGQYSFKDNSVIKILEGAENNIPDSNSEHATTCIVDLVKNLNRRDILLVLISGGGSALLALPTPPVTLDDKISVIKLLQKSAANIAELNFVRMKLSTVKGGGLLNFAYPAEVISFILSDIVGDPLDLIASGPTLYNESTVNHAKMVLEKYLLLDKVPSAVKKIINEPNRIISNKARVQNFLIGSNKIALESASDEAKQLQYEVIILSDILEGLVSDISVSYVDLVVWICKAMCNCLSKCDFINELKTCKSILKITDETIVRLAEIVYNNPNKLCMLVGGEPTVKIIGSGKGGRSQQLALQFSYKLNEAYIDNQFMENFNVGLLCGGTDGLDGPTDAAGAVSYNGQMKIAEGLNLDPNTFIQNCDSYTFFTKLCNGEDLLKIGHTGTNVMDIHIFLIERNAL